MKGSGLRCALLFTVTLGAGVAKADTITQTFKVTFQDTSQTAENSNGFLQFNTNLGTLNSARADFTANIQFAPAGPNAKYTLTFSGYAGGSGSPAFTIVDNVSEMFQTNAPVDPGSVTGYNGFANYFLAFIDLSVQNGTVLAGSTATGTLTYNYTPAAVTPEPSTLLLLGTALVGAAGHIRRRVSPR